MASPAPREHPAPLEATTLLELAFGDQEFIVAEYRDGVVVLRIDDNPPLLVNLDQLREVVVGFRALGKAKGWK